jgi:hypothetical protein
MTRLLARRPLASTAGVAEQVDARDLKSLVSQGTCRFDSGRPHQKAIPALRDV